MPSEALQNKLKKLSVGCISLEVFYFSDEKNLFCYDDGTSEVKKTLTRILNHQSKIPKTDTQCRSFYLEDVRKSDLQKYFSIYLLAISKEETNLFNTLWFYDKRCSLISSKTNSSSVNVLLLMLIMLDIAIYLSMIAMNTSIDPKITSNCFKLFPSNIFMHKAAGKAHVDLCTSHQIKSNEMSLRKNKAIEKLKKQAGNIVLIAIYNDNDEIFMTCKSFKSPWSCCLFTHVDSL
ncbi:CLUMA_CG003300, isoform A [Clunio marinus]|uniref:CLUMA_CG003300, isoform A n=1 Tax=Clunio marinus TaxID=568069 RepID=A0A1J1HND8_9DIPT|nr:CLUMA_CG003300, isoform A [Clunio marinus]